MVSFLIGVRSVMFSKFHTFVFLMIVSTAAMADFRLIVPQNPGQGTSVWASIVGRELEKHLGEKVVIEHIPGANDIPGFNKFHNELRNDPKVIMVAHGGNAESYLLHQVDYDYKDYAPIGLQNMTIVVGHRTDINWKEPLRFNYASGSNPDAMALTLMMCGPDKTFAEYKTCYEKSIKYILKMTGNEAKLAYMRGELTVARDTPAAYIKYHKNSTYSTVWFDEGVLDIATGKIVPSGMFDDKFFNTVFKQKWGVEPSGDLFNAYVLVKNYRDVLQKSLWVDKNNPNIGRLRTAMQKMISDKASREILVRDLGDYQWLIGDDVNKAMKSLKTLTKKNVLKDLVYWNSLVFKQPVIFKDNIAN